MATIELIKGFCNLDIGKNQLLRIKKVSYDEKYDKLKLTFEDADGRTLVETFFFKGKKKGTRNLGALGAFSTLAKCATKDFSERPIDPTELKGLYVIADVYEQIKTDDDGKELARYLHIGNYKKADDVFENEEELDDDDDEEVEEEEEEFDEEDEDDGEDDEDDDLDSYL